MPLTKQGKKLKVVLSILRFLFTIPFLTTVASGQLSTSSIAGVVLDASGAAIGDATVSAMSEATGISYESRTSSVGAYTISYVSPSFYTLTISKQGFRSFRSTHNILTVGAPLVVDATLTVGPISETIQVESSYERLNTVTASVSDVITPTQIASLPLNGRNPLALITLGTGVVQRSIYAAGSDTHVFGSRDRSYNITIDGIDANDAAVPDPQNNIQRINPDTMQEYRTVTLNPTAELGRNSGANVMIVTKAGGNSLHGSAFYFLRNTVLNANEWFSNAEDLARPVLRLNQYGFQIGGPIIRNKTFLSGSIQNSLTNQSVTIAQAFGVPILYVPTLQKTGVFRFLRGSVNVGGTIVNQNSPLLADSRGHLKSGVPVCGGAVTTNCVDSYNIFGNDQLGIGADSKILSLLTTFPTPNSYSVGDGLNFAGFNWDPSSKSTGPDLMIRLDHTFGPRDNLFARWLQNHYDVRGGDFFNGRPAVFPGFPPLNEIFRSGRNLAVSWRHAFSPNLVNDFIIGFNRFRLENTLGESNQAFGDPNRLPPWADGCYGSFVNIASPLCGLPHTARAGTVPQFIDNVSWAHGTHIFRFGVNVRLYYQNDSRGSFGGRILVPEIAFDHNRRGGLSNNLPPASAMDTNDFTALQQAIVELEGIPASITQSFRADFRENRYVQSRYLPSHTRAHQYNFYADDEWKWSPKLTVRLGLRWELNPPPYDTQATLVPNKPIDGTQGPVRYIESDKWYRNSNWRAIGPRIGIAWSPNGKSVLRAGYGLLFDTVSLFQVTSIAGQTPGAILQCTTQIDDLGRASTTGGCVSPAGTANRIGGGFPVTLPAPTSIPSDALSPPAQANSLAPAVGTFDPNLKNPAVHEWNLSYERELPQRFTMSVGYVGKRGTHLLRNYDLNQIATSQPGFLQSFNIARQNILSGCKADGTDCPPGVIGSTPSLLLALSSSTFLNGGTSEGQLRRGAIGSMAVRIDNLVGSAAIAAKGFPANYFRSNPQFSQILYVDSGGDSYYHGLYVTARRRFEKNLEFGFNYVLGKSIDNMSVDPIGAPSALDIISFSRTPTDIHNFRLDRARSDFDNRHVITSSLIYQLPFGHGQRWSLSGSRPLAQLLGGWSATYIFDYQSGEPFTIGSGVRTTNGAHSTPAEIRGPMIQPKLQFLDGIVGPVVWNVGPLISNPADPNFNCRQVNNRETFFCIPPPGSSGSGRNRANGLHFWNVDLGVAKEFAVTIRLKLQFRAEFFNLLNHPNFDSPANFDSATLTNSNFGQTCCGTEPLPSSGTVIAIGEPNRVIQFGLKLLF